MMDTAARKLNVMSPSQLTAQRQGRWSLLDWVPVLCAWEAFHGSYNYVFQPTMGRIEERTKFLAEWCAKHCPGDKVPPIEAMTRMEKHHDFRQLPRKAIWLRQWKVPLKGRPQPPPPPGAKSATPMKPTFPNHRYRHLHQNEKTEHLIKLRNVQTIPTKITRTPGRRRWTKKKKRRRTRKENLLLL